MFYFSINTKARPGDEQFGLSLGRLYLGLYSFRPCFGILNANDAL